MVNEKVIIIVTILIILVFFVVGAVLVIESYREHRSGGGGSSVNTLPACTDTIDIATLPVIPDSAVPCYMNGVVTSMYYLGDIDPTYPFVVAPFTSSVNSVCVQFCDSLVGGVCTGTDPNAQLEYNNCVLTLGSTTCAPPKPLAAKGPIVYYAQSPTSDTCQGPPSYNSKTRNYLK